jgi:hypothetical protein
MPASDTERRPLSRGLGRLGAGAGRARGWANWRGAKKPRARSVAGSTGSGPGLSRLSVLPANAQDPGRRIALPFFSALRLCAETAKISVGGRQRVFGGHALMGAQKNDLRWRADDLLHRSPMTPADKRRRHVGSSFAHSAGAAADRLRLRGRRRSDASEPASYDFLPQAQILEERVRQKSRRVNDRAGLRRNWAVVARTHLTELPRPPLVAYRGESSELARTPNESRVAITPTRVH